MLFVFIFVKLSFFLTFQSITLKVSYFCVELYTINCYSYRFARISWRSSLELPWVLGYLVFFDYRNSQFMYQPLSYEPSDSNFDVMMSSTCSLHLVDKLLYFITNLSTEIEIRIFLRQKDQVGKYYKVKHLFKLLYIILRHRLQ